MRPKLNDDEKLNSYIVVRVTKEEKQKIYEQFEQERFRTLSDFARNRLLKKRLVRHITVSEQYFHVFRGLDYQLAKIGNNLNQIAHKLNAYSAYMLNDEDKKVFQGCYEVQKACLDVLVKFLKIIRL